MLLVGSSIWFYEGREEVNPIPVAPSPVAPPVVVPRDPLPLSVPKVAAAVREKRRPVKPVVPVNAPDLKGQPLTIKFLTDDPNVIIYWLVDGNGD
jgi:hypothetical protein